MSDRINFSLSMYKEDVQKINNFAKKHEKNFRSQAEIFRYILNSFFKQYDADAKKDFVIHWVYPILLGGFATFGTVATQRLIEILYNRGLYFQELHVLNGIFVVLGAFSVGFFGANMYWYFKKKKNME